MTDKDIITAYNLDSLSSCFLIYLNYYFLAKGASVTIIFPDFDFTK